MPNKKNENFWIAESDWPRFKELMCSLKLGYGVLKFEKICEGYYKIKEGVTNSNIRKIKKMIEREKKDLRTKKQLTFWT